MRNKLIKFLPSYVGSKSRWINKLSIFQGKKIIEPFCGSSVISSNLASSCILNDLDPMVYNIIKNFDQLIVPEEFSSDDFFKYRKQEDWWKYSYCLQKMSFSGVFRYSKNGYNVPIKDVFKDNKKIIKIRKEYEIALKRWQELKPEVYNLNYTEMEDKITEDSVVVLDPPYKNSQASYNINFNHEEYKNFVNRVHSRCETLIIFDYTDNLSSFGWEITDERNMRVNGRMEGSKEGMIIVENKTHNTGGYIIKRDVFKNKVPKNDDVYLEK